ncbi:MAG: esterase-like activity of phytase family protein [Gammaproteobacteria bacterium]
MRPLMRPLRGLLAWLVLVGVVTGASADAGEQWGVVGERFWISDNHERGQVVGRGIRLLGTVALSGERSHGLSGLAWEPGAQRLFAVSDLGFLLELRLIMRDGFLVGAEPVWSGPLLAASGRPLRGKTLTDAEGLAWVGGEFPLCVSFERQHRVRCFDRRGRPGTAMPLLGPLSPGGRGVSAFSGVNSSLESLMYHSRRGLIAAPERHLRADPEKRLRWVSLVDGRDWTYALSDRDGCAQTAMEPQSDDAVLVIERCWVGPGIPLVVLLREARFRADRMQVEDLLVLHSGEGWKVDNFEGLAVLGDGRFVMVSDDNANVWQQTLLVMFERVR